MTFRARYPASFASHARKKSWPRPGNIRDHQRDRREREEQQQQDLREDHPERERAEQQERADLPAKITTASSSRWYWPPLPIASAAGLSAGPSG